MARWRNRTVVAEMNENRIVVLRNVALTTRALLRILRLTEPLRRVARTAHTLETAANTTERAVEIRASSGETDARPAGSWIRIPINRGNPHAAEKSVIPKPGVKSKMAETAPRMKSRGRSMRCVARDVHIWEKQSKKSSVRLVCT